ncbi:MAG TPA: ABC transporter permease [Candidatus Limnocylindrales bacterium]|nr:ABC transporter permease [Candidatus Limnocylindrales bacterium]
MTAATPAINEVKAETSIAERKALRSARIRGVVLAALGLFAIQLSFNTMEVAATFSFWISKQGGEALSIGTTVGVIWILTGTITAITGILQLARGASFPWRRMLLVIVPFWVVAALAALLAGKTANMTGVLAGTLNLAAPIALGAFAGIISERSGMANIAIEGKFLIGACAASVAASVTMLILGPETTPVIGVLVGILAAMLAAMLVSLLLAWLGIRWKVDQIIAGIVINIGAVGITNFLFLRILSKQTELNTPPTIENIKIPLLSDLPVLGPLLFSGSPYLYITLAVMVGFAYMLYRTRWGLRLRASGEKPSAAGTVGIDVIKIRYRAMLVAGLFAGLAGSSLSLASAGSFQMQMSAGRGFIALAAVIFGAWNPIYAFGAALVFAFADNSQTLLSALGVDVPAQILNSVPYVVTIVVVAGVVGRVRGPAAAGQPYDQG